MTEIPEHLLKRSKAAKSGKTGGDAGSDDGGSGGDDGSSTPVAAEQSSAAPAVPAANLPNLDPEPDPPKPVPAYVAAAKARKRIPIWVLPIIAALPVWAGSFAGTMQIVETEDEVLLQAEELYGSCSSCHGANGGGGVGYQLSEGEVLATFPEPIDMMVHVARGSGEINGQEYGAERSDGVRVAGARGRGLMPAQLASLNQLELELVVFHERAILSGEDTGSEAYQEWIKYMREAIEAGDDQPIDLDFLLQCANPDYTPGATGEGSDDEAKPCPGPHGDEEGEEAEEAASG